MSAFLVMLCSIVNMSYIHLLFTATITECFITKKGRSDSTTDKYINTLCFILENKLCRSHPKSCENKNKLKKKKIFNFLLFNIESEGGVVSVLKNLQAIVLQYKKTELKKTNKKNIDSNI